ncbi:MAG: long-chain fatty acid--CoA ligase [Pseudomonadota bacterium]
MSLTSAVRRAAQVRPQGLAILQGEQRTTWPETASRIARMAGALRTRGVTPGKRVATLALNSPEYFELLMAVWWAGAVLVPLNTRLAADEIAFILDHAQPCLLVMDEAMSALGLKAAPTSLATVVCDAPGLAQMLGAQPIEDCAPGHGSTAGIFYTGGTTGKPKGVELSHQNFAMAAVNMQRDLAHREDTVYLHASPMFHLADFGIGLGVTLAAGGHSFMPRFTPEAFYERLRRDRITHLQLVPTMLAAVLDAPCRDDALLAGIQRISYGAAPIASSLLERTLAAFPNARIHQFYGMTESCGASVMLPPERHVLAGPLAGKLRAAGQVTAGFELRIADEAGAAVAPGTVGEIQVRGPAVMTGYWNDPQQTAATVVNGWLRSGDGGFLDEDGFVHVVDRLKDMIISGGENIYSAEVESALASHPGVLSCAVVGLPDERWGERVHAVVIARPDANLVVDELDAHCRAHLAGYKVPRSYDFADALPLSGIGKVQKKILREQCVARGRVA